MCNKPKIGVRGYVRDASSMQALSRVPMTAEILLPGNPADPAGKSFSKNLGVLSSEVKTGYVSFKVEEKDLMEAEALYVYPVGRSDLKNEVLGSVLSSKGQSPIDFFLEKDFVDGLTKLPRVPSIQEMDEIDYVLSPTHGVVGTTLQLGDGNCEALVPSHVEKHCFPLYQVVVSDAKEITINSDKDECKGSVSLKEGKVLEFENCWEYQRPLIGEMLYSVPLAPCETVKLAMVDWRRQENASRGEDTVLTDIVRGRTDRSRIIDETVDASLKETNLGGGLAVGLNIGVVKAGVSFAASRNTRDMAVNTVNSLSDSLVQQSSAIRRQRSVVVYQATQQEEAFAQTRAITNHNHCHTLNFFYHQVVNNFKVTTCYKGEREVILIKYPLEKFTLESAYCAKPYLQDYLLDPDLRSCFDAIGKVLYCSTEGNTSGETGGGNEEPDDCVRVSSIRVKVRISNKINSATSGALYFYVKFKGGQTIYDIIPKASKKYDKGESYYLNLMTSNFCIDDVAEVGLKKSSKGDKVRIQGIDVDYTSSNVGGTYSLYANNNLDVQIGDNGFWWGTANPNIPSLPDPEPEPSSGSEVIQVNTSKEEACCAQRLLAHLNCHLHYYRRLIWMQEDPNARACRLECYTFKGKSLLSQVVNQPIAVMGKWVAFPLAGSDLEPAQETITSTKYLTLPTSSVFAEALMGNCNTCEKKNDDVFWDWSESPCSCSAPDIEGVSLSSRGRDTSLSVSTPGNSIISLQGFPDAPSPSSLTELLKAFADPKFSDPKVFEKLIELLKTLKEAEADPEKGDGKTKPPKSTGDDDLIAQGR